MTTLKKENMLKGIHIKDRRGLIQTQRDYSFLRGIFSVRIPI